MTKEDQAEINHFRLVRKLLEGIWTLAKFEIFAELDAMLALNDEEMAHLLNLALEVYQNNDNSTTLGVAHAATNAVEAQGASRVISEEPGLARAIQAHTLSVFDITSEDIQNHWEINELL